VIPALSWPDDSLRFLRDGYLYGTRGFEAAGADAFRTRLLGRPVVVARGMDAARFFYEGGRFRRGPGAVPASAAHLLQDEGSVQTLEDGEHTERKRLFLGLAVDEDARADLLAHVRDAWLDGARSVQSRPVAMTDFAAGVLTDAVLRWSGAGTVMTEPALGPQAFTSMIENAGRFGPPNWAARTRRLRSERRAAQLIERARARDEDRPLDRIARFEERGERLPARVAAIELLNLLRPTVAVARYVAFAALALHRRPEWRDRILTAPDDRRAFAHEVRRFFPFFPAIGGRATRPVEWRGETLPAEAWMLLDLYGTDHDPATWPEPRRFDPERFLRPGSHPPIVAQGAGDYESGHRCPGEPLTEDLVSLALELLAAGPAYRVPAQDLRISLRTIPAAPRQGFRVVFDQPRLV
jgi:fatty-acid peroxygenase